MSDYRDQKDAFAELDGLLDELSQEPLDMSEELMTAILHDASTVQQSFVRALPDVGVEASPARMGWLAEIVSTVGGWGAISGLVAASSVGVWIGFAAPEALMSSAGLSSLALSNATDYTTYETFDLASVLVEE